MRLIILIFLNIFLFDSAVFGEDLPARAQISCDTVSSNQQFKCNLKLEVQDGWIVYFHDPSNESFLNFELDTNASKNISEIAIDWRNVESYYDRSEDVHYYISNSDIKFNVWHSSNDYTLAINLVYAACNKSEGHCATFKEQITNNGSVQSYQEGLIYIILSAILGGIILNFMPCILPVILMKIVYISKKSHNSVSSVKKEMWTIFWGIICSFLLLAAVTVLMKALGNIVGWGIHFQQPIFVGILALITGISAINMCGFFELQVPAFVQKIFNKVEKKHTNLIVDFLHGVFIVLLATPCTAPFLATSVAFCLSQDTATIILVYLSIGVGLGLPYIIMILYPKIINYIPKPGKWMAKFRLITGVPFAITAVWLLYVLFHQINNYYILICILALIISPMIRKGFLVVFISIIMLLSAAIYNEITRKGNEVVSNIFEIEKVLNDVKFGRVVLVNITSHWCITCKVNEKIVLKDYSVVEKLNELGVVMMTWDYTNNSDSISAYIKQKDRSGIPLNVVYGPAAPDGIVLPVIFSKDDLFDAIKKAQKM
jgi:suppressor for copper-sensitivity B